MKRISILLTCIILFSFGKFANTYGQARDIGNFIAAGPADAEALLEAYLSPWINAFGGSMTGGWYNTAKPHELGGFDLTLTFNTAFVPSQYKTYNVDELGLESLVLEEGSNPISPTVAGSNENGPQMQYNILEEDFQLDAFDLPPGTGFAYVPTPMIQVGVGLWFGTEIMGRFFPRIPLKQAKVGMWGFGLKHDIKQWIPGLKDVPVLNISLMGGYTRLNSGVGMEVTPEKVGLQDYNDVEPTVWENQEMILKTSSLTANLLISADLPVVTFYGGVGFATTKTNLKFEGNYPMLGFEGGIPFVNAEQDPIDIEVKNKDGGITKPRLNVGMRFKFGVFTMHFDYVRATYNVASFGLGISFR